LDWLYGQRKGYYMFVHFAELARIKHAELLEEAAENRAAFRQRQFEAQQDEAEDWHDRLGDWLIALGLKLKAQHAPRHHRPVLHVH
jgi:hypothetical protein